MLKKKEEIEKNELYNLLSEDTMMEKIKKAKSKNMDSLIKYFETFLKSHEGFVKRMMQKKSFRNHRIYSSDNMWMIRR